MTARRFVFRTAWCLTVVAALAATVLAGCAAHTGRLTYTPRPVSSGKTVTTARGREVHGERIVSLGPMFGDTAIGLLPGTADSTRRYLGRLRAGYTADTLNLFLVGDNRPGNRTTRLAPQFFAIQKMFSGHPMDFFKGLVAIPVGIARGLYPDLALFRDIPGRLSHVPTWGPEGKIVAAMVAKLDSLQAHGENVSAVINTGDLVYDGRYPGNWERFLRIHQPITSRVPYFPVAGNHERTDSPDGIANWRTATGLPVGGERLYYCFDSADGWVRFIALDSNPMADANHLWTREVQIKYSEEEITWMVARIKEHTGPTIVVLHSPPFSVGFHRTEWQSDSVLVERRERMMKALHEAGIGILASGHEHAYERAIFKWPDAVLVSIVTGGGGAPLHIIPPPAEAARMFSEYKVAGSTVDPANVVTGTYNHFIHLRLWFGGGELFTYAVDAGSHVRLTDNLRIDLARYGVPVIDEHKMPVPPKAKAISTQHEEMGKKPSTSSADSVATSKRLLSKPSPRQNQRPHIKPAVARRDSLAVAKRDSLAGAKRDSTKAPRRKP